MEILKFLIYVLTSLSLVLSYIYKYRVIYKITGLFATRKFPPAQQNHKYAVMIAARNEEPVIGNLIESIHKQDYDSSLVTIFVVADNCTDKTAEIAAENGAICYVHTNPEERTKGFALRYLVDCIKEDYGIDAFEGYFIFDADNLLKEDYISRMNEAFDAGEKLITSYRNSKNFDRNWISASYSLHWLRTVRNEHRAKSLFRLATRIQGTGFLFANEIIADGWNYTSLTEDRALSADSVVNGYRISYNHEAVFYDEQPTDIKIAMRQRIRWAKGHLQACVESGPKLLLNSLRFRRNSFVSFDMLTIIFPYSLYLVLKRFAVFLMRFIILLMLMRPGSYFFALTAAALLPCAKGILKNMVTAAYIFLIEHKRIMKIKWYKKLWFCFTFPLFDLIGKLSFCIALFKKVEWTPIPHKDAVKIDDITEKTESAVQTEPYTEFAAVERARKG